jgi:hypothetical protein
MKTQNEKDQNFATFLWLLACLTFLLGGFMLGYLYAKGF